VGPSHEIAPLGVIESPGAPPFPRRPQLSDPDRRTPKRPDHDEDAFGQCHLSPIGPRPTPRRVHIFRTNANNQVRNARLTALIQPGALKRTGYAELWDMICAQEPLQLA
jgi:hypothetical protein